MTILWSATATSLGSSTTGMIRTFYPQINELLLLTIKPYPDDPPSHQGRCRGQGPLRKPFSKQKPSGTHQFILQIGNVTKMEQVRKLTANEMTCELPNGRQPSNLGVRLQPSKSQVGSIACPTTSSSETFRLCLKGTPCDCAVPPSRESRTSFSSDGSTIPSWSLQTSPR